MDKQGQIFVSNLKEFEGQHVDFFNFVSLYALDVICGKFGYILNFVPVK